MSFFVYLFTFCYVEKFIVLEQYSIGVFVKDIIDDLTARGIFNRGKPFARNTVYNILKNEKYSGVYHHNGEEFDNIYPQIVPTDIFRKVRAKVAENKNGKASVMTRYLLKNKVICGYCGKPMTGISGTSKTSTVSHYYRCKGKSNHCEQPMIRREVLDETVLNAVASELSDQATMGRIVAWHKRRQTSETTRTCKFSRKSKKTLQAP